MGESEFDPEALDEEAFESRLAWIFGSPRCGSTWLLRLLCFPLEPTPSTRAGVIEGRRRELRRRLRHPWLALHREAVAINEPYLPHHLLPRIPVRPDPANPSGQGPLTLNERRSGDPHYFFSEEYAYAWRPPLRRLILIRLAAQVERAERDAGVDDPVVIVKEPNGSYGAELTMSLLERARLIFLVRDGRDVIDSLMDGMRSGGWLDHRAMRTMETAEDRLAFAGSEARAWLERTSAVERAFEAHPPELRWRLRYEDLRADTFGTLRPLVDWLGVRRSDAELKVAISENAFEALPPTRKGPGTQHRAATPGLWKQNMSPDERKAMEDVMGPKLAELGYDV
ncbi:MAG TPA: sulfotransferase [Solirubrobacterales bacterium]